MTYTPRHRRVPLSESVAKMKAAVREVGITAAAFTGRPAPLPAHTVVPIPEADPDTRARHSHHPRDLTSQMGCPRCFPGLYAEAWAAHRASTAS